jgi:hypothetical protein
MMAQRKTMGESLCSIPSSPILCEERLELFFEHRYHSLSSGAMDRLRVEKILILWQRVPSPYLNLNVPHKASTASVVPTAAISCCSLVWWQIQEVLSVLTAASAILQH